MNTQPNPEFCISAKYLGPIFDLSAQLTSRAQNLIFARNGTGKSFLSRAFRYLDLYHQKKDIETAAHDLVSDEAIDGKGTFVFSRGTQVLGKLQLEKHGNKVTAEAPDTIFHVFSEDFVQEELREKLYKIDGKIENQIAVDSDEIQLNEAKEEFEKAKLAAEAALKTLQDKFDKKVTTDLIDKAGINKQLKEYRSLNLVNLIERLPEKPPQPEPSFANLLGDLDSLKAIPSDPQYPGPVTKPEVSGIDLGAISTSLQKITSPSSVSETIKEKIETHHAFYEAGADIVRTEHRTDCPFCEQSLTASNPRAVVDAYIAYFADEEEKHKKELRGLYSLLTAVERDLDRTETDIARQKTKYDTLRQFIPSLKEVALNDCNRELAAARSLVVAIKTAIEAKAKMLASPSPLPAGSLTTSIASIGNLIDENNDRASRLAIAIERSDEERKSLQRSACAAFEIEFAIACWSEFQAYKNLLKDLKEKSETLIAAEQLSPKSDAKTRAAETFEILLKAFFENKYLFDKNTFILRRGDHEMTRGPHRTLSDGEKTAIAFCYFIASIHRKVEANSDYKRLFLVFDDPVTSMSYDFVFTIAQTLKNLTISEKGEVSIDASKVIDGNKHVRPNLLILTHSSYFFNISLTNSVVKSESAFALQSKKTTHVLSHLKTYIAPFQHQLRAIYEVANGSDPDYGTGNAIRSVLEAVGRFCRPDKSKDLTNFITFLAGEDGMEIKSVLINNLSHGTYYDESPTPEDIRLACEEVLRVVERYAEGQLELMKKLN